jgi:hypothetical protein
MPKLNERRFLGFSVVAIYQTLSVASGAFSALIAIWYAAKGHDAPRPSVLGFAYTSVIAAWLYAYDEHKQRLKAEEKPRPALKLVDGDNDIIRFGVMHNSGQVGAHSESGDSVGLRLRIENVPPPGGFGAIAENVTAQVTFSKEGRELFVADGWWPERYVEDGKDLIRYPKHKNIGVGAREYLEIAFKFYYSPSGYGLNDASLSYSEWCNPQLELESGSYSASMHLLGPNVDETVTVNFTNEGMSNMWRFDPPVFSAAK